MTQYLILHKVRGEPAFDVAEKACVDNPPCQPNCGCWNPKEGRCLVAGDWIIPTSGHKAYPFMTWNLEDLVDSSDINKNGYHPMPTAFEDKLPADWPEHFAISDKPVAKKGTGLNIMDFIKIPQPTVKLRRRI